MTTILSPYTKQRFFDNNGNPLVGGLLTSYAAGTTTPIATYKDSTGGTPNTNPIVLNFRGEADIWLQPNVAYKFALTDAASNAIPGWPIDNIVSSQLITLYGGVDTGVVNAYVLNFTANFTAYTDGIVIYWIPANTNTGASTINVNSLGVVSLVNPNGSALVAGQIIANQPATILFKAGQFQLISSSVALSGTFVGTWGGFGTPPATTTLLYRRTGFDGCIILPAQTGISNATSFTLSGLPAIITTSFSVVTVPCLAMIDNSVTLATTSVAQLTSTGLVTFFKDASLATWTAANNKGFNAQIALKFPL